MVILSSIVLVIAVMSAVAVRVRSKADPKGCGPASKVTLQLDAADAATIRAARSVKNIASFAIYAGLGGEERQ